MERNRQFAASACPDGNFHSPMLKCVANQRPSLQEGRMPDTRVPTLAGSNDERDAGSRAFEPLRGDGEMARLIREWDWTSSPLGYPDNWPQSLKTAVGLLLPAAAQIVLFWGPEFVAIYNDAYAPTIGDKHPRALGRPAVENSGRALGRSPPAPARRSRHRRDGLREGPPLLH